MGVFPPMKVNHTDAGHQGQIYIGQVSSCALVSCHSKRSVTCASEFDTCALDRSAAAGQTGQANRQADRQAGRPGAVGCLHPS